MGPPEAPRAVSVGLRNCYLALPRRHKLFRGLRNCYLAHVAAFDGLSPLLCHGSSRGPTGCFCWASKLLSGTSEAPQAVSIGLRNCYLARFQHPLKASKPSKPSKPSQQLSTAFRCFAMGPPEAHELFLLGFETAIWHFRGATSCFYWASKLLSGTCSAPLKTLKGLKTLPAAFDGLSLLCHGTSRGPTSCFCWASKLLSGTSEAPQAVSIGLRNCYLARFQHPLKPSFRRPFAALPWVLPRPHRLFLLGFETAIWHFRSATSCLFYWASKLLSGTFSAPLNPQNLQNLRSSFWRRFAALPWVLPRPHELFLLGFETAIWHFRSATSCFYWASKLLSGTFSAPLKTLKTVKTLAAAFDGRT